MIERAGQPIGTERRRRPTTRHEVEETRSGGASRSLGCSPDQFTKGRNGPRPLRRQCAHELLGGLTGPWRAHWGALDFREVLRSLLGDEAERLLQCVPIEDRISHGQMLRPRPISRSTLLARERQRLPANWIDEPQPREAAKTVVVRRKDEAVLDCKRSDLDVRDVIAAYARRRRELGRNRCVSRTGCDDSHGRLLQIRGRHRPTLQHRDRVLPEHPRACDQTDEGEDDRPTPPDLTLTDTVIAANGLTASAGITPQGGGLYTLDLFSGERFAVWVTRTVIQADKPDQCVAC